MAFVAAAMFIALIASGCVGGFTSGTTLDPEPVNASQIHNLTAVDNVSGPSGDPLTPACPAGYTLVTSIDGTLHCKGPDGYVYDLALPGATPARSADRYQWLGDHPPGSAVAASQDDATVADDSYQTVEPPASANIPAAIAAVMRPPNLDWTPPAYTSTVLPDASLVIGPDDSLSLINTVQPGQMVIVRGNHSSGVITVNKPIILKGEDGAVVGGIDIHAPCIVTGFSVTGRNVGIFANGVSGTDQYPFIIEGNHCYWNGYGLRLYYCNNVVIKDNLLESNSEIELHVEHMANSQIVGNNLGEAVYKPGGGSVDVDGAALRYVTDTVFEDNYIGEHYYGTRWYSCRNDTILDNVYRNSGTNLRLGKNYGGGDYGECDDMTVTGNDIRCGTDAIWAEACADCVFDDNVLMSKYGFKSGMGQNGSGSGNQITKVIPPYG